MSYLFTRTDFQFFRKMQPVFIVLGIISVWLLVITILGVYIFNFFRNLSKGVERGNFIKVLGKVLEEQKITAGRIETIKEELIKIENESRVHLQKVGIIRFNPFEELGGDHSFSVALLDARDSGFIITGLHTRERTRVYVKNIKRGKPEAELSLEEKKALRVAQRVS